jgi:hypothetical protein
MFWYMYRLYNVQTTENIYLFKQLSFLYGKDIQNPSSF